MPNDAQRLRAQRLSVVGEHMESENIQDFERTMATFSHPRYEMVATGQVHDGAESVMDYFVTSRQAFPDQRNENAVFHPSDHVITVEFDLLGTHLGPFLGFEPTGREFRCPMAAIFLLRRPRHYLRARLLRFRYRSAPAGSRPLTGAWGPSVFLR